MEVGYLTTMPQQLHDNCPQFSVKVVKLLSFEVSKNSGKTSAGSTTLSEGERIGCERTLVTLKRTPGERKNERVPEIPKND